jgi:hypothetical protein
VLLGIATVFDTTDFHIEAIDLLGNHIACEAGIALIIAIFSAIKKAPALPGLISTSGGTAPLDATSEKNNPIGEPFPGPAK